MENACKKCRSAGQKLFLKGDRCYSPKCAFVRRPQKPGLHGKRRGRGPSEFGRQLAEKQSLRFAYDISERQFKRCVQLAMKEKGDNRENLMRKLETRLDNAVFRLGLVKSRSAARQLVGHGHILVNGRKVSIPSYQTQVGDKIALKESFKKSPLIEELKFLLKKYQAPDWLVLDKEKLMGEVKSQPSFDVSKDLTTAGLVIEYYSR